MVEIQLLGVSMDSQIVMMVIGVIGLVITVLNYHKKSPDASKKDSSQSVINSSGIVQQSASQINIDRQIIIHNTDKKFVEISKPNEIEDIEPQLTELHQPLKNQILYISKGMKFMDMDYKYNLIAKWSIEKYKLYSDLKSEDFIEFEKVEDNTITNNEMINILNFIFNERNIRFEAEFGGNNKIRIRRKYKTPNRRNMKLWQLVEAGLLKDGQKFYFYDPLKKEHIRINMQLSTLILT